MDEDSVRARRAEHARKQRHKDWPVRMARKTALPGLVVLILAGVGAGFYWTSTHQADCPGHWHATFQVYVNDDLVSFKHPQFDMGRGMAMRNHLHQPNDSLLHLEAAGQCSGFSEAARALDMDLKHDTLSLEGKHEDLGQAGIYRVDVNHTLQAYHAFGTGNWTELPVPDLMHRQLRDGERILILYGSYDSTRVSQLQATVPLPPGAAPDTSGPSA